MDSDNLTIPGLGTLCRQVTSGLGVSGDEDVTVSWEGRIQLPKGGQLDLYLAEDVVPSGRDERRRLVESLNYFFDTQEERLRYDVAAELLDLVNLARATREYPVPPLTLETLLPRLTLEDMDWWGDGASSVTYNVDEPESEGRPVWTEYDEEGRLEVHTSLLELLPLPDGFAFSAVRVPFQIRAQAARAIFESRPTGSIEGDPLVAEFGWPDRPLRLRSIGT